jgi:hypothetical protein
LFGIEKPWSPALFSASGSFCKMASSINGRSVLDGTQSFSFPEILIALLSLSDWLEIWAEHLVELIPDSIWFQIRSDSRFELVLNRYHKWSFCNSPDRQRICIKTPNRRKTKGRRDENPEYFKILLDSFEAAQDMYLINEMIWNSFRWTPKYINVSEFRKFRVNRIKLNIC